MRESFWPRVRRVLDPRNIGVIYVWIGVIALFGILRPETFLTIETVKVVLNQNAILGLVSLSLVVPLCAAAYDLSIGYVMALASVTVATLIVKHGFGIPVAIIATLLVALIVGMVNGLVVVVARIDSFIGTLATGAIISALVLLVSGEQAVTNGELNIDFGSIAAVNLDGVTLPVFVCLAVAVAVWWLLENTVTGRRLYATGFNEDAARLAGVRTKRVRFGALLVSALVAGIAGLLLTSQVGTGSPEIGPTYLLDAFAAAFLGATQFRNGRFNAPGTVVAVLMLGTGDAGLTLLGAPSWSLSMFHGVVLLLALTFTVIERREVRSGAVGGGEGADRGGHPSVDGNVAKPSPPVGIAE
jgi:ribose transport system permease protein